MVCVVVVGRRFFFNDTATTEIYTLSLHDALPISRRTALRWSATWWPSAFRETPRDRKSTRLNSSHANISYAVFCLKKKNKYHARLISQDEIERHYRALDDIKVRLKGAPQSRFDGTVDAPFRSVFFFF